MYQNAPVAYFSVDANDASILNCNLAAQRLLGYSKKALLQMKVFDLYADTEHGLPIAKKVFKRFKAGEFIQNVEMQIKNRAGKSIWVSLSVEPVRDQHGKIVRSRSILTDISDRRQLEEDLRKAYEGVKTQVEHRTAELLKANQQLKQKNAAHRQAERTLNESENNFRALAENASDAIVLVGGKGANLYVNKRMRVITGYSISELLKIGIRELAIPDELPTIMDRYKRRLRGEDVLNPYETSVRRKDGKVVPVEVTASKTIWQGSPAVMAILRDITERKCIEKKMAETHIELKRHVDERTLELTVAAERLERQNKAILHQQAQLEKVNLELIDTNKAVTILARNIDKSRQETENAVLNKINSKLMPIIEDLRKAKSLESLKSDLDILTANLQTLSDDLAGNLSLIAFLTPAEMRVATMIKNGLTSQDLADKLYISLHTAKTHRRNIRKKLNVKNSRINLASYLKSLMW